jgi:UDP-N-acetylmuramoyl-L-alanyl-D-glutamate--2,6-diaminopimelate ligase
MKLLQDILYKVRIRSLAGRTDLHITDVQIDSRLVGQGSCFVAIKGASQDGHAYIDVKYCPAIYCLA